MAHERSTATRVTRVITESVAAFYGPVRFFVPGAAASSRAREVYAGTASRSFFAFSISFWAMCAGTSS